MKFLQKNEALPRLNTVGVGVNDGAALSAPGVSATTSTEKQRSIDKKALPYYLKRMLQHYNSPDERPACIIAIDKLRLRVEACVKDAIPGEEVRHLDNDITLQLRNGETGTPLHRCYWDVFHGGELVGTLESGGRLENMARYDYLTINNNIIWQKGWNAGTVQNVLTGLNAVFDSVANLDICIDGLNDVIPVFNQYIVGNMFNQQGPRVVRSKKGGSHIGTNKFDDKIGAFEHYYIGKKGADKRFVVYEKNQEISHISPHKQYIRETWDLNGIDADGEVWRSEIRLKGKVLDAFNIQDLELLESPSYLMQIYKTATDGFVDFRITDGKVNINNAEKIDLLQFIRLGVERLQLVKKNLSVGLYKAKMAIHSAFQHAISNDFARDEVEDAMKHVQNLCNRFNLREYLVRTLPRWMEKYKRRSSDDVSYLLAYV